MKEKDLKSEKKERNMKKLYRSRVNKKISGLCGGLGNYFKIDPVFIRLLFLFVCFFTIGVPAILAYIIATIIVPLEPINDHETTFKKLYRSNKNKMVAGVCAGVAKLLEVDVTIVRLFFLFFMIITGVVPMVLTYFVAWIILPQNPNV